MASAAAKQRAVIGLIVVVLVAGATWLATRDRSARIVSTLLYPEFAAQLQTAERVRVFATGEQRVLELVRQGKRWSVLQRDSYPADTGKVGVLLQNIAELRVLEEKTAVSANYPALGVEDLSSGDAQGVRLEIVGADASQKPLIDLIVGKQAAGLEAAYVRKSGDAPGWLVSKLEISRNPGNWIEPAVTHVDTDRIHQAIVRVPGQPDVTFTKANRSAADFTVAGLPRGQQLSKPSAANGLAAALLAVQAEDVRRSDSLGTQTPAARATYRMFDGLQLELTGWVDEGRYWIALTGAFDAALAAKFANDKPDDNTRTSFWRTPEQVQKDVERLQGRATGWAFRIPEYKYEGIFPAVDKWVQK